jgi:facilitated trehalose transporter
MEPACLKPFAILVIYFLMYQFSGVNTITFYAVEIFQDSGSQLDKYTATIMLGTLRFLFTIVACILLRRCGRRPLSFISGIGCSMSMFSLGTYMFYKHQWALEGIAPMYTWIPVASIFVFIIACTLGFLVRSKFSFINVIYDKLSSQVVPWVMIGELYPMKVRGVLGGMTLCMAHTFVFIVVKTYPFFCKLINVYGVYAGYGMISLCGKIKTLMIMKIVFFTTNFFFEN